MLTGLVAGFGEPIGLDRLWALKARGFRLLRQDVQAAATLRLDAVLSEARVWTAAGGSMLYIVDQQTVGAVPEWSWIEYLNEAEYLTPLAYVAQLEAIRPIVEARRLALWAGSIGNLDRDSLAWLTEVVRHAPWVRRIAVHRYPVKADQAFDDAHAPCRTREDEVYALRRAIGAREFLVSEVGYHTASRRVWWVFRTRLSDARQAYRQQQELDFWRRHGAQACCLYQNNDGPTDTPIDRFGLYTVDGRAKTGEGYR